MRVLVVGAGAVGQVYGTHLALGGAEVSVFVRPKHAREAARGYDLFAIHSRRNRERRFFRPHRVLTDAGEVAGARFDQIWLCVPSTAVEDGSMDPLVDAIANGESARGTLVTLQPGTFVKALLSSRVPEPQIVVGIIGLQSYHAPLEGSSAPYELATGPGTAYFFPPLSPCTFSGVGDRAIAVVDALRMGGAPARVVSDAWVELGFSSAMLMPPIAALEAVGWSLERFRTAPESAVAARAARQAIAITAREMGQPEPALTELIRPFVLRLAFGWIGPRVSPYDLEAFLRVHFEKVGAQTRLLFDGYLREAVKHDLPCDALEELRRSLDEDAPHLAQ